MQELERRQFHVIQERERADRQRAGPTPIAVWPGAEAFLPGIFSSSSNYIAGLCRRHHLRLWASLGRKFPRSCRNLPSRERAGVLTSWQGLDRARGWRTRLGAFSRRLSAPTTSVMTNSSRAFLDAPCQCRRVLRVLAPLFFGESGGPKLPGPAFHRVFDLGNDGGCHQATRVGENRAIPGLIAFGAVIEVMQAFVGRAPSLLGAITNGGVQFRVPCCRVVLDAPHAR